MNEATDLESRLEAARQNPQNLGEMENADAVGTVGSPDCGDMLRMWVKFKQDDAGKKVIDRATFQTFGCQTAIAVASLATELIRGKTAAEALAMSGEELAAPLGPLPPMKIHCAQLVEGALKSALAGDAVASSPPPAPSGAVAGRTLYDQLASGVSTPADPQKKLKVVLLDPVKSPAH
ncbi:MAG: iron-sulfur cluster assembly scaffold protein [Verrucomicrobia bacterium]|nr:iron-sulfur cluster assembly scaffold protein [Verrucomicrobiota bacterium]